MNASPNRIFGAVAVLASLSGIAVWAQPLLVNRVFVGRSYDASEDGDRFLMLKPVDDSVAGVEVVFVENWFDELERLVLLD